MADYLTQITKYLLAQSWQIAILVVVMAGVTLVMKNRSAHFRYLLWLIVLTKCLMPPLLAVPLPVLPPDEPTETVAAPATEVRPCGFEMVYAAVPELPPLVEDSAAASVKLPLPAEIRPAPVVRREFTIRQWLAITWLVGVTVFFLAAVLKALRTESQLRRRRKPLRPKLRTHIANQFASFGVRPFPRIWLVEGLGQPFVWGLLRGSIYLPADFIASGRDACRRDILSHELSHVLRFDAAVNILQVIAQTLFWFHPLVWWANARIRAEREKCCDETAIARLGAEARDYSSAIVEMLACEHRQNRPVPSLAVAGSVKNVEERIKTMMIPGRRFYKRPSLIATTIVLLLALLTAPTAFVLTARAQAEAAPQPEQAPAPERVAEPAAREGDQPRERQELLATREPRGAEARALEQHREELQQRARQIERELADLRDDEDGRARDLLAEQREIREQLRNIEREFADRAPERRRDPDRQRRDMVLRERMEEERRALEEEARRIGGERAALLREGMEQEARQRADRLEEIHELIRNIDARLAQTGRREPGDRGRPGPEERRAAMMQERNELAARARELRQQIERLDGGEEPESRELRNELQRIERRILDIDRELGETRRDPGRGQEARVDEMRREIERLAAQGRHDQAVQLERDLQSLMRRREERRDRPTEAPDEDLRIQVRQLREEVTGLRNEMRELRTLIERLLEREPRDRPETERPPQESRERR